jgi:hypothetical protein
MSKKKFNDEALLRKLNQARKRDPGFKKAAKDFIDAEAKYGKNDPCEGKVFVVKRAPK